MQVMNMATQFDKCPRCGTVKYFFGNMDVYECKKCKTVFCNAGRCDGRCPNCGSKDDKTKIGYVK